jgi:hypothetical protein
MHFRQKLAFFAFGCAFVIVGQVVTGLVVPSATAQGGLQDAEFNTVTVRELNVVDATTGILGVHIATAVDGGILRVMHADGTRAVSMGTTANGGGLRINQADGTTAVSMGPTVDGGGSLGINRNDGAVGVILAADSDGAVLSVTQADGTSGVVLVLHHGSSANALVPRRVLVQPTGG